jgi:hypothetical protein
VEFLPSAAILQSVFGNISREKNQNMIKKALLVRLEAKPGKEGE